MATEQDMLDVRGRLGIVYLAAPYSAGDGETMRERLQAVTAVAGELIGAGYVVFSPLTYSAQVWDNEWQPPAGWYEFDLNFLHKCGALVVLQLDGWEDSRGVALEIGVAEHLGDGGLPMLLLEPGGPVVQAVDQMAIREYIHHG